MPVELEAKFAVESFEAIRHRLEAQNATYAGRVFEQNRVYDTVGRDLRRKGVLLRLRHDTHWTLTLKTGRRRETQLKMLEELESELRDGPAVHQMLLVLGYVVAFTYEKVREKWLCDGCLCLLDRLPFGNFVELEGERQAIMFWADRLGLEFGAFSGLSYAQIHALLRRENGQPAVDDFVFTDHERRGLEREMAGLDMGKGTER